MTEGPTIRVMTPADVPAVLRLEQELFPHDAWPEQFFHEELAQAEPAAAPTEATRKYWVVEDQAQAIIGYAGMMCVLPLADVQTLAVSPQAQGQGLGSRMLKLIEQESTDRGAEDLLLEVRADNPAAQRLYIRHGFVKIHQRIGYYPDGGDALIMRKRLREPRPSVPLPGRPE